MERISKIVVIQNTEFLLQAFKLVGDFELVRPAKVMVFQVAIGG
jgi:hypothetical protein